MVRFRLEAFLEVMLCLVRLPQRTPEEEPQLVVRLGVAGVEALLPRVSEVAEDIMTANAEIEG